MKVASYFRQGPAREVIEVGELPTPEPGAGEVRVRIRASGVNPSDVKSRSGLIGRAQAFPRIVPHSDGAGVIVAVGAGVDQARIGERVWLWNGQWKRAEGTAAEYIVLPSMQAVALPASIDFETGACFGIPLLTAVQAVNLSEVGDGDTVLVSGGAGAVAHYVIQVAARRGARVISTVSSPDKAAEAKTAGAAETINYRDEDIAARLSAITAGRGVDALIELDLTANAKLIPAIMRPHGTVVVYGMSGNEPEIPGRWMLQNNITMKLFLVYELSDADRVAALADISDLLHERALIHRVAARFPLEQTAAAHELVESGTALGNVVVLT